MERHAKLLRKTRIFALIVILTNVLGNCLLSVGLRENGSLVGKPALAYLLAMLDPFVAAGVVLLTVWMIAHMMLLSWADLSYVLPVTSMGYVMTAVVGRVFLHENVSWTRWAGVAVIVAGFTLVSRTPPSSKPRPRAVSEQEKALVHG